MSICVFANGSSWVDIYVLYAWQAAETLTFRVTSRLKRNWYPNPPAESHVDSSMLPSPVKRDYRNVGNCPIRLGGHIWQLWNRHFKNVSGWLCAASAR